MSKLISKQLSLILAFIIIFSASVPVLASTSANDYNTNWASETIQSALDSGNVKGYSDGSFKPENSITRAEFFSIVNNFFEFTNTSESTYTDVESSAWYAPVISITKAAGYNTGYTEGSIHPNAMISRQESAVILSRLAKLTTSLTTLDYTDAASVPSWSKEAIIMANEAKIMIGYPDNSFQPTVEITRAEALFAIKNCYNYAQLDATENDTESDVSVSDNGMIVEPKLMTLTVGGTVGQIMAEFTTTSTTDQEVIWSSSDVTVATVLNGVVTPLIAGSAIITATSATDETISASTVVTVITENQITTAPVNLGSAADFVILSKSGISTVPISVITGNIGVSPIEAAAITGFSLTADATNEFSTSAQITGKVYASNYASPTPSNLTTAISDLETAYTDAAGRAADYTELYSGDISGKTLTAGVYKWGTGVLINTDVTLHGDANDVWIFQIAEGITQAEGMNIILTGGAQAKNIFWQAAETVSIGANAHFEGIIISQTNISLGNGASINGRLLAQTAVTLNASTVVGP
jgi:hypothetical protein